MSKGVDPTFKDKSHGKLTKEKLIKLNLPSLKQVNFEWNSDPKLPSLSEHLTPLFVSDQNREIQMTGLRIPKKMQINGMNAQGKGFSHEEESKTNDGYHLRTIKGRQQRNKKNDEKCSNQDHKACYVSENETDDQIEDDEELENDSKESPKKRKYRTGRWTAEEHNAFLKGLKEFGNNWAIISKRFVKTRTRIQVASHSQSHFKKLEKKKQKERNINAGVKTQKLTSRFPSGCSKQKKDMSNSVYGQEESG